MQTSYRNCRVTRAGGLAVTRPPPVPPSAWGEPIAGRYRRRTGPTPPLGTVLVHPAVAGPAPGDVTYRTDLRVVPRLQLTVAVHRHEETRWAERLLTRLERVEPAPPGTPAPRLSEVDRPVQRVDPTTGPAGAAGREPPPRRTVVRPAPQIQFEPVPRVVRTGAITTQPTGPAPTAGAGSAPALRPAPATGPRPGQVPEPVVDVDRLTEHVIRAIDHRALAQRERRGRA